MARDSECKLWLREEDEERGCSLEEERKREATGLMCITNRMSEKGEQREMSGIQKRSRTGRSVVCVCACVRERARVCIQGGMESEPETERRG